MWGIKGLVTRGAGARVLVQRAASLALDLKSPLPLAAFHAGSRLPPQGRVRAENTHSSPSSGASRHLPPQSGGREAAEAVALTNWGGTYRHGALDPDNPPVPVDPPAGWSALTTLAETRTDDALRDALAVFPEGIHVLDDGLRLAVQGQGPDWTCSAVARAPTGTSHHPLHGCWRRP